MGTHLKYDTLIFDLDGTISDPKQGIVNCMNYALTSHGFSECSGDDISRYIGPPLDVGLSSLASTTDKTLITSLVSKFRERYSERGFSENTLYPGVVESLEQLSRVAGLKLGVCTSKRVDFAERILEMFSIRHHFEFVSGGDVGIEKWQQLAWLLEDGAITEQSLMIGDRAVDLTAAHKNKLQSLAVLWGYGSLSELSQHNPVGILTKPSELASLA